MTLRSTQERVLQTLTFEVTGLLLVCPLYAFFADTTAKSGFAMTAILSLAVMIWSPLHNTVWDLWEQHHAGRCASDRPSLLRVAHAISHEISSVTVTCPLLIFVGGHSLGQALACNIGLTLLYTSYAYVFHVFYDRLRPVRPSPDTFFAEVAFE